MYKGGVRRAVPLLLLAGILVPGLAPVAEPTVCTAPCGGGEEDGCPDVSCSACVSLAVVRVGPEPPVLSWTAVDVGAAGSERPLVPRTPPASEILHVPRHLLS